MPVPCTVYYVTSCDHPLFGCGCGTPNDWSPAWPLPVLCGCGTPNDWSPAWTLRRVAGGGHPLDLVSHPAPTPTRISGGAHSADTVTTGHTPIPAGLGGGHPHDTVSTGGIPLACTGCSGPPNATKSLSLGISGPSGPLTGSWTLSPLSGHWGATSGLIQISAQCQGGQLVLTIACEGGGATGTLTPTSVDCSELLATYAWDISGGWGCSVPSGSYTANMTWQT